jgi:hypothetical protein
MRHPLSIDRRRRLALLAATLVAACCSGWTSPAGAQSFDIHAPESKRGAVDLEVLNGVNAGRLPAGAETLRKAHEFKYVTGLTDRWMFELGALVEKPTTDDTRLARISLENIFVVKPPVENGFALGWYVSAEIRTSEATHNSVLFGPLIQYNAGKAEFLINPILHKTFGANATSGIDLNYIWRAKVEVQHGFGVGAMGYGNIEDLGAGSTFNQQDHRIGPALFFDVPLEKGRELDISVGTFFGMTSASPEASLMINFGIPLNRR